MRKKTIGLLIAFVMMNFQAFSLSIHDHGYWCGKDAIKQHQYDPVLAKALVRFFHQENARTIVDFGCGTAEYVKEFRNNFFICDGYDGNPDTLQLTRGIGKIIDLSEPFDLGNQFDWVLSLEVGEHLPKQFETIFIENLHYHNIQGIVLSWAIEGQGGYGHFNERNNDYVKGVMASYGYINDVAAETELRKNVSGCSYFRDTLMVFRKTYQP